MSLEEYPEWAATVREIAGARGTVLLLGATDAGKTTFGRLLVNEAFAIGKQVTVVDGDIGQSEIGPPGCVGWGRPTRPIRGLSEIEPAGLAFVGSTAPRGNFLQHATAVRVMADTANPGGDGLLIVDTTGFVRGGAAVSLKQSKIRLLAPRHIVALQRHGECEPILVPFRFSERPAIHRLPVAKAITSKPPALRAQRRALRFAAYFANVPTHTFGFDDVAFAGTWLGTGKPLEAHLRRFLSQSLGVRVYHAEMAARHLGIVTDSLPHGDVGLAAVQETLRYQEITITPASRLRHLLTGLSDGDGKLLPVGLIDALDFRRRQIGILAPVRAPGAVRLLEFGLLRVRPDGTELGTNRPGDV
jgi:polynucleotide 5'-hydroxyl-kinase GRC3/NOL9